MCDSGFDEKRLDLYYIGELSDRDTSYINELFSSDKHKRDLETYLYRKWNELEFEETDQNKDLEKVLKNIHRYIRYGEPKDSISISPVKILKWTLRIAAILVAPVLIYLGINNFSDADPNNPVQWIEISALQHHRINFSLKDGTTGWLNSGSKIRYNNDFIHNREIFLEGEAYFDVYKDTAFSFKVFTESGNVTVLGTRFNIASYKKENSLEIALLEGAVLFESNEGEEYLMDRDDYLVYDKTNNNFRVDKLEYSGIHASWIYGELVFRNSSISDVIRRLERRFGVDFIYDEDQLCRSRLWATFSDEDLEEVLSILKLSLCIDYEIKYSNLYGNINHVDSQLDKYDPFIRTLVIITSKPNNKP